MRRRRDSYRAPVGPGGELGFLTAWRGQTWEPHPGTRGVGSARAPGFPRALTHILFSDPTTAPLLALDPPPSGLHFPLFGLGLFFSFAMSNVYLHYPVFAEYFFGYGVGV